MSGFSYLASSFAATSNTASSSSITINTVVESQTNDVILLVATSDSNSVSSISSTNTTWTKITDFDHTNNDQYFSIWRGVLTGTLASGSTITVSYGGISRWRGVQIAHFRSDNGVASPPVQTYNYTNYLATANPTTANGMTVSVSPTGTNSLTIVEILEIEDEPGSTSDSSPGTGFTQIVEGNIFTDPFGPYLWAYKTGASSGTQNVTATYAQSSTYMSSIVAVVLEGGSAATFSLPLSIIDHYKFNSPLLMR